VNCPLLQAVPENEELQRRCAALLEAIKELPVMGEQVGVMGWDGENFFPHFFWGDILDILWRLLMGYVKLI
jgi:hypothetical protein